MVLSLAIKVNCQETPPKQAFFFGVRIGGEIFIDIVCFIERYRKINVNDLENRKRLIDTFVNSIYLYDDKIVFAFNYKDGTRELTLKELEEELSSDLDGATPPQEGRRSRSFFVAEIVYCEKNVFVFAPREAPIVHQARHERNAQNRAFAPKYSRPPPQEGRRSRSFFVAEIMLREKRVRGHRA